MLTPKCNIAIATKDGTMRFTGCNEFTIKRSVEELSATGTVYLPTMAMFDSKKREIMAVREKVNPGDKITIHAGYDEHAVYEVFNGYIKAVNTGTRVKLDVEGGAYTLRKKALNKNYQKQTLKSLLLEILKDTDFTPSEHCAPLIIDEFPHSGNVAGALAAMKEKFGLTVFINENNEVYAGLETNDNEAKSTAINVAYGVNIVSNDVEYKIEAGNPLKVVVKGKKPNGKEVKVEAGVNNGDEQAVTIHNISDKTSLQIIAGQKYKQQAYDGFSGTITLFGLPYAKPGGTVVYKNENYKDVEGRYFIKAVDTTFNTGGLRQILTMGYKL